jgi:hypothetical protein
MNREKENRSCNESFLMQGGGPKDEEEDTARFKDLSHLRREVLKFIKESA